MKSTLTDQVLEQTGALRQEAVEQVSDRLAEPGWMRQRRLDAWRLYESMPLPDANAEEWRRTDIRELKLDKVRLPDDTGMPGRMPVRLQRMLEGAGTEQRGGLLVQRDGDPTEAILDAGLRQRGVLFSDLTEALRQTPDRIREELFSVVRPDELKFRALHAAFWSGGTYVYVPPGVEVAVPLVSASWIDTAGAGLFPHTLLVADEGSQVTLVDMFASTDMAHQTLVAGMAELILKAGARVRYVAYQDWGSNVWELSVIRAHVERDATLNSLVVGFGARLAKTDVESRLLGPGGSSEMLGLYFGENTQHFDFHTLQEHFAPHTTSDLLYKGAVKDGARTVFAGLIRVHPGAQKTNAFQINRNLILNVGAKSDSIPKLEIMANDLRCTHGSATSRLQDEHLFYLMSRGLNRRQAVQMVVDGFFSEVLDRVPLPWLDEQMRQGISAKMEGLDA